MGARPEAKDDPATAANARPWTIIMRGMRLLSPQLRRRVVLTSAAGAVMAVLEAASFALLFLLIRVLSDTTAPLPSVAHWIGAGDSRNAFLARCGAGVLALFLVKSAGSLLVLRIQSSVQASVDAYLANSLFRKYVTTPYLNFIQMSSSEMVINIQFRGPDVAANGIAALIGLSSEAATLTGVGVTLAVMQPALAVGVMLFMAVVALGLLKGLTPAIRRAGGDENRETPQAQRILQESIVGIKAIKANELGEKTIESFMGQRAVLTDIRRRRVFLTRLPQFYLENALFIGLGVLAVVVFQSGSTQVIPIFGVLVAAAFRILPSVSRILQAIGGVRASQPALESLEQAMAIPQHEPPATAVIPVELRETFACRGLTFRYLGADRDALTDVSFDIAAGESVGVVGPSGSGKTTLVDVVLGLLDTTEGALSVDGRPLTADLLRGWRHTIGYVPQDVFLLESTLRENITFGRPDQGEERLAEVLRIAQLDSVVAALPEGLEAPVGDRGIRLSGGQRQRIGIARALYARPSLLILDEATAALDTKTEAAITESVHALHGQTTTIVIAHRLSTVQHCDRIIYLENGRVRSIGSFEELHRTDEGFADLVRLGGLGGTPHPRTAIGSRRAS
ncbi:MAG: ATP-binding cassette, subfamily bacterial PglK [Actinomycetota bacterium]|nr:ATP-binding cassette, subfamily bacterial PglK [Actinomycetota bacterium]